VPSPTSSKRGRLHGTRRPAKTSRSVGCSRRRTLPGPRPPALPHRLPRTADREGARGAVLPRPAANCLRIADRSDNYRNTVNRVLKRFRDRGLVGTADGHYEFNADFDRLHEFAREIAHHLHRHRLEAVAPKGTILWEDYDEFLAQAETEIDAEAFHETGLARFAAFDLQFLLTDHRYYVYSEEPDAVSPAELCCHTLLIDDGSRHRSYCLLLLSHVDIDEEDLREQAVKYGLEDVIDALLQYLETQGEVEDDRLLAWSEFQKLAGEYEIER